MWKPGSFVEAARHGAVGWVRNGQSEIRSQKSDYANKVCKRVGSLQKGLLACDGSFSIKQKLSFGGKVCTDEPDTPFVTANLLEFARSVAPPRRGQLMFFVYAIQSRTCGRIYIGQSERVERRLQEHNAGQVPSTKCDRPWALLRFEEFTRRSEARWFERQLKQSRGRRLRWLGK